MKRLYKIVGMSSMVFSNRSYGTVKLVYHQEARPATELVYKNGAFKSNEELRAGITLLHTQFKGMVQGQYFEINDIGEIKFLNK